LKYNIMSKFVFARCLITKWIWVFMVFTKHDHKKSQINVPHRPWSCVCHKWRSISSLLVLECVCHMKDKWILANVNITRNEIWRKNFYFCTHTIKGLQLLFLVLPKKYEISTLLLDKTQPSSDNGNGNGGTQSHIK